MNEMKNYVTKKFWDALSDGAVMWAAIHRLAAMANMEGFHYDGDWGELTEKLLVTKMKMSYLNR